MTAFGLAHKLTIDQPEAEKLILAYFDRYPRIAEYFGNVEAEAREHGFVRDISGRRRRFPVLKTQVDTSQTAAALREAKNFGVQAAGSIILREATIGIHDYLAKYEPEARIILIRHDEIQVLIPEGKASKLIPNLKELAESVDLTRYGVAIPLRVTVQVGRSWASLEASRE